uniref:Uncharacterized protein n=1 Tax=Anguilla anguilla TaxID=7936 RepID=A0A0E9RKH2_ANGAN
MLPAPVWPKFEKKTKNKTQSLQLKYIFCVLIIVLRLSDYHTLLHNPCLSSNFPSTCRFTN